MEFKEFAELPAFAPMEVGPDGFASNLGGDLPVWSGPSDPPEMGDVVYVAVNNIGPGRVVGYFVQCGYLGAKLELLNGSACFAFGAELEEVRRMKLDAIDWAQITEAQAARLLGAARQREQAAARAWDRDDTPETKTAWEAALELEENLLIMARCGVRPQNTRCVFAARARGAPSFLGSAMRPSTNCRPPAS